MGMSWRAGRSPLTFWRVNSQQSIFYSMSRQRLRYSKNLFLDMHKSFEKLMPSCRDVMPLLEEVGVYCFVDAGRSVGRSVGRGFCFRVITRERLSQYSSNLIGS